MNTIKLIIEEEEKEFNIPSEWGEVTVEQFAKVFSVDRENCTQIELSATMLSIFTGIDEDYIYMMTPDNFKVIAEMLDFLHKEIPNQEVEYIEIEGERYYLKSDFNNLSMGEVISLELIMEQSKNNIVEKFPELLCIFLRKKDVNNLTKLEPFKKSFMERANIFKNVPITKVNSLFLFFSNGETSSENSMKVSSEKQ